MNNEQAIEYGAAQCPRCKQHLTEGPNAFYYAPANDWIVVYPEDKLVHIHYSQSTIREQENIKEATWVHDTMKTIKEAHSNTELFVIFDMTASSQANEFIPSQSMDLYKDLLTFEQFPHFVGYGMSAPVRMIVNLAVLSAGKTGKKVRVVKDLAHADKLYHNWKNE